MNMRFKPECIKLRVKSKLFQSRSGKFCKPDNISDTDNQNEVTDVTPKKTLVQSTIPAQKNGNPQKPTIEKPCIVTAPLEKQHGGMETVIEPLWPTEATYAKSAFLVAHEIRMRTVVTPQDKYRLLVQEPRNTVQRVCRDCKFYYLCKPRPRKPLIVIDMDALKLTRCVVPPSNEPTMLHLLDFLYRRFDFAIWSSQKMHKIIPKLEDCGYFKKGNTFKINFVLDVTSLTARSVPTIGFTAVKDLDVIWNLYPQYNEHNCILLNYDLKKVVYGIYGVPVNRKQDKLVDEVAMTVLIEFLVETMGSTHSLAKLNTPIWKKLEE